MADQECACGLPLHYRNPELRAKIQAIVDQQGEYIPITVRGQGTWMVQRHYIALHGIRPMDLPTSSWEKVEILHDSPFECDECGGPSPATSHSGCPYCGGQGDIVRRGMARRRTWRP